MTAQTVEHAERFTASGNTLDVTYARVAAWEALRIVRGTDPVEAWTLKHMTYGLGKLDTGEEVCTWQAEFTRQQD
jgi:hypothetical protein